VKNPREQLILTPLVLRASKLQAPRLYETRPTLQSPNTPWRTHQGTEFPLALSYSEASLQVVFQRCGLVHFPRTRSLSFPLKTYVANSPQLQYSVLSFVCPECKLFLPPDSSSPQPRCGLSAPALCKNVFLTSPPGELYHPIRPILCIYCRWSGRFRL